MCLQFYQNCTLFLFIPIHLGIVSYLAVNGSQSTTYNSQFSGTKIGQSLLQSTPTTTSTKITTISSSTTLLTTTATRTTSHQSNKEMNKKYNLFS